VHHISCPHDCPDTCSILVTVNNESGKAVRVQGDPTHPITKGYLCNKVNHYLDFVYSPNRINYPHKRVGPKGAGARFVRISWDEALTTMTESFKKTIAEYGTDAVQPYSYSGTLGMVNFWGADQRFWNKMNAARLDQSICIWAALHANLYTYGVASGPDTKDIADAEYIILWGCNAVSTGVHMVPFLQEAKRKGAKIVAIDPRTNRTTHFADWHIPIKPGTDGALALGMMKVIVDNNLHDEEFLKQYTVGWDELLKERLPLFTLDRVEQITGVPAKDIEKLALEYARTKKSVIRANYGLNRHDNSGSTCRNILILPAVTGAWREEKGGAGFGVLDEMWLGFPVAGLQKPELGERSKSRVVNMVQIGQALNDPTMDPPIKSMFVYNSDPANCVPDTNSARKGMMRDDLFVAVHDIFWTDTCDYADIVIPASTQLEHEEFHAAYGHYFYGYSEKCIEPLGESMHNAELFRQLAKRMGYTEPELFASDEQLIRDCIDTNLPLMEGLTFEGIKESGWARASVNSAKRDRMKEGWPTPSGKIEIKSSALAELGLDPLPDYTPEKEGMANPDATKKYPLQVLSTATHYFIGDTFQHVPRLAAMQSRPTVEINREDAKARGIQQDDLCRLYNDRGETFAYAVVTDGIIPGVLGTNKQYRGSATPGGVNANALNSQTLTDFGSSPTFYSALAEIEKVGDMTRNEPITPDGKIATSRAIRA
jgi:anaerobic selenocysteine-containing dehydrogenase